MICGQNEAIVEFSTAWRTRRLHHAWLLTGPKGVGKASFAKAASLRILAEGAGPAIDEDGIKTPSDHPVAKLIAAGSHPDYRFLERLERPSGGLARNISVDQIRSLGDMMAVTPSLSPWRAIVIDSADDLETSAANALLKMLEEPPANTIFFLVSHAPGRLLPTIRSRCRKLDFSLIGDDIMTSLLSGWYPEKTPEQFAALIEFSQGSPGRAKQIGELDLAPLEAEAVSIMREGDLDNSRRSKLASSLGAKASAERYAAFLALLPGLIAREAIHAQGEARGRALDAYAKARELVAIAPRLSLDPAFTIFQLGGVLASVALKP